MAAFRRIVGGLRGLDKVPPGWGFAVSFALTGVIGAVLAATGPGGWVALVVIAGAAVPLALSGRPVGVVAAVVPGPVESEAPAVEPATTGGALGPLYTPEPVGAAAILLEPLDMVELPGGTFPMGEAPGVPVTVSPFAIARFPVTQALYREVVGSNPGSPWGGELPVNMVSWYDAARFCNALSERAGLRPCYAIQEKEVAWTREAEGYRLPTDAEWEYACRAGATTEYFFGDDPAKLGDFAWYDKNSGSEIQPVGKKLPNRWGLHDLLGNVLEWCWDWHGRLPAKPEADPTGPARGDDRVLRGGSFWYEARRLRSALRFRNWPVSQVGFVGFRCVRSARPQHRSLAP